MLLSKTCLSKHARQLLIIKGTWTGQKHLLKLACGQDTGAMGFFLFLL